MDWVKKLVIGVPGINITFEELDYLCTEYNKYIESWYLSPPFGEYYSWKGPTIPSAYTLSNIKFLKEQINIIRAHNLKIRLVLNNARISNNNFLKDIDDFIAIFGAPDYLVLMHNYIDGAINTFNIPIVYSCMNEIYKNDFNTILKCNCIVLNSEHNYNINLMQKLKYYNKQIELIVNNACGFWCNKTCDDTCTQLENTLINKVGLERTLALQALFPCELELLKPYIDFYKISNRPSSYNRTKFFIDFWINNYSLDYLKSKLNTVQDYKRIYNMAAFRDTALDNLKVSFEKVLDEKNKIWSQKLGYNVDLKEIK